MMTIVALGTTAINHIIYRELGSCLRQTVTSKREFPPPPRGGEGGLDQYLGIGEPLRV